MLNHMMDTLVKSTEWLKVTDCSETPRTSQISLESLPNEILHNIIKFTVVDTVPIVDPRGNSRFCSCGAYKPHGHIARSGVRTNRHLNTFRDMLAEEAIRDARHMSRDEYVVRAGINPAVLLANKLCNNIGTKYLYESNAFLFTNAQAMLCFAARFPFNKIRHVQILIKISQWDAEYAGQIARRQQVQNLPDGPWYSRGQDPHSWWTAGGETIQCPFSCLETLEVRLLNWRQWESINVNGTPHVSGTVHVDNEGKPYTISPPTESLEIKVQVSQPLRIVRNFNVMRKLTEMINCQWVAQKIKVTGCEDALEYRELQEEVSRLSNLNRKIIKLKATAKVDRAMEFLEEMQCGMLRDPLPSTGQDESE